MDITTKFKISFVFLSVDELPSWTVKLYLPETAGYTAPVFHLCPFSGLELDLVIKVFETHATEAFYRHKYAHIIE